MKKIIILLTVTILSVGVCWTIFQSKPTDQKLKEFKVSDDFEEILEKPREASKELSQNQNYMFAYSGDYRYFQILNWEKGAVLGYRYLNQQCSLEFIIGNLDCSEVSFFTIPNVVSFKEITFDYSYYEGEILYNLPSDRTVLQFSTMGEDDSSKTYILENDLTVWEL